MSIVVGVEADDHAWLAWDSYCGDWDGWQPSSGKVVQRSRTFAVGVCGGGRALDVAQTHPIKPPDVPRSDALEWVRDVYVPGLRAALKTEDTELDENSGVLIAVSGALVVVDATWSVSSSGDGYTAIGAGGPIAIGALAVTARWRPKGRAEAAAWAACRHHPLVGPPVYSCRVEME